MKIMRTYKFRLKPNVKQESHFMAVYAGVRAIYNAANQQRILYSRKKGTDFHGRESSFHKYSQVKEVGIRFLKADPELKWIADVVPAKAIEGALADVQQAWDSVISNRAKGETSDDPGYRTFAKDNSFRLPVWSKKKDGCDAVVVFGRDFVRFPKMGYVRYIKHRKLRGSLKTASVIKDGSRWYVCVSAEIEVADPVSRTPDYVGVDLGVEDPIVLSNGEGYTFVPTSQKNTNRAKQLQRKISRQKKGSNRRKRTVAELSQLKRKEAAQKKSQLHKITTDLVANYTHIGRENLSVKKMTQSANLEVRL